MSFQSLFDREEKLRNSEKEFEVDIRNFFISHHFVTNLSIVDQPQKIR